MTAMPITDTEALTRVIEHREIFHDEMLTLMRRIMAGEMSPVIAAALITGLRVKKETIGEITAAAQVMREFSTKVHVKDATHIMSVAIVMPGPATTTCAATATERITSDLCLALKHPSGIEHKEITYFAKI